MAAKLYGHADVHLSAEPFMARAAPPVDEKCVEAVFPASNRDRKR